MPTLKDFSIIGFGLYVRSILDQSTLKGFIFLFSRCTGNLVGDVSGISSLNLSKFAIAVSVSNLVS